MHMHATGSTHRYVIALFREGEKLQAFAQRAIEVDWEPAKEWLRFEAFRRDPREPLTLPTAPIRIEPLWQQKLKEPYVGKVRLTLEDNGHETVREIPTAYFAGHGEDFVADLIKAEKLSAEDKVHFAVWAYPHEDTGRRNGTGPTFTFKDVTKPLPLQTTPLARLLDGSTPHGDVLKEDMPVIIPRPLLDEMIGLTEEANTAETGGMVIGLLHRDPESNEVFAEATAQIPARHATQELASLTFTAETWTDAQAAIALRKKGETYLGWWHSHPARAWCSQCPEENRKVCKRSGEFFSAHDVAVHRTAFCRAHNIALVISDSYANGITYPMFGWRQGMVQPRGFYIRNPGGTDISVCAEVRTGKNACAT
jgi:proteasome lid subunit RPN8/RPN11